MTIRGPLRRHVSHFNNNRKISSSRTNNTSTNQNLLRSALGKNGEKKSSISKTKIEVQQNYWETSRHRTNIIRCLSTQTFQTISNLNTVPESTITITFMEDDDGT